MNPFVPVETWLYRLNNLDKEFRQTLFKIYGSDETVLAARKDLLQKALALYRSRFGNDPVRVFRCPGRVNLRGMHVDTHGGYLNLITHHRETVLVVSLIDDTRCTFVNINAEYEEVHFDALEVTQFPADTRDWDRVLTSSAVKDLIRERRGHWCNYLQGVFARVAHAAQRPLSRGVRAVVASDLPAGAGLSSSHSVCTGLLYALCGLFGVSLSDAEQILCVRDAEWYAGARSGVSDQGAMILCKNGELVNAPLYVSELDLSGVRRTDLSDAVCLLVLNSCTTRSLSGAQLVEYTRNRFAYSMALDIFRQELRRHGVTESFVRSVDRLARLSPDYLKPVGGLSLLYSVLMSIPERISVEELRSRYVLEGFEQAYSQYFGGIPEEDRPTEIAIRGPLLYGIAESERARKFFDYVVKEDWVTAGKLMTIGHDGDRRVRLNGQEVRQDVSDVFLARARKENVPIELLPGDYGASSPALDSLVDSALEAGALGACLTGAGIAGSVIALCKKNDTEKVSNAVKQFMRSNEYAHLAGRGDRKLSDTEWREAVILNYRTAGAGEIMSSLL